MYEDVLNIRTEPMVGKNMKEIPAPLGKTLRIYEYSSKKMGEEQVSLSNFYYLF